MESSTNQTKAALAALTETAPDAVTTVTDAPSKPALTSKEIVLQKLDIDLESPLTSAFWRELRRYQSRQGSTRLSLPPEVGKSPEFPNVNQFITNVALSMGAEFHCGLTEDEIRQIAELQSTMDSLAEKANNHSVANVSQRLFEERDKVHAAIRSGEDVSGSIRIPTREQVAHDYRLTQQGFIAVLVKMTTDEVLPLCKPILERFNATLEQEMMDTEVGDRWLAESWGLAYTPSIIWRAMAHIAGKFSIDAKFPKIPGQWRSPKQILEGIIQF